MEDYDLTIDFERMAEQDRERGVDEDKLMHVYCDQLYSLPTRQDIDDWDPWRDHRCRVYGCQPCPELCYNCDHNQDQTKKGTVERKPTEYVLHWAYGGDGYDSVTLSRGGDGPYGTVEDRHL